MSLDKLNQIGKAASKLSHKTKPAKETPAPELEAPEGSLAEEASESPDMEGQEEADLMTRLDAIERHIGLKK